MTLDTTTFPFANDSLPDCTPGLAASWVPTDFTDGFENHQEIVQDVYRHLVQFEDSEAINDSRYVDVTDTWIARVYRDAPAAWQTLYKTAFMQPQEFTEGFESPYYHRPSLWLLHKDWMHDNACDFVVDEIPSSTFHEEITPVMDRLIYPYQEEYESVTSMIMQSSNQEIIAKVNASEYHYLDIPDELIDQFSAEERRALMETLSVEELVDLIKKDKIEDNDIPQDKYADVYAEIRQK